jgi:ribose 1,5-bisphosphate isomerase
MDVRDEFDNEERRTKNEERELMTMSQGTPFHSSLRQIIEDRDHGASELARRCLDVLAECTRQSKARSAEELIREMTMMAEVMSQARPSMAPLRTLIWRWGEAVAAAPRDGLERAREYIVQQAEALKTLSSEALRMISLHVRRLLTPGQTILTHSVSGVLLAVFEALRDLQLRIVLTESRPRYESRRLIKSLSEWGCEATVITDAQAGIFAGRADAVLVGADSVLSDRTVINKAGTYLIALAARDGGVPFYVACQSYKFERLDPSELLLEEGPAEELGVPELPHVKACNIYFDRTPARLVTAWITEEGLLKNSPSTAG